LQDEFLQIVELVARPVDRRAGVGRSCFVILHDCGIVITENGKGTQRARNIPQLCSTTLTRRIGRP
jgi:hypothetical protein